MGTEEHLWSSAPDCLSTPSKGCPYKHNSRHDPSGTVFDRSCVLQKVRFSSSKAPRLPETSHQTSSAPFTPFVSRIFLSTLSGIFLSTLSVRYSVASLENKHPRMAIPPNPKLAR